MKKLIKIIFKKEMVDTDVELIWVVIYFIVCTIVYFMIFGVSVFTILCSFMGIPITTFMITSVLLFILNIINFFLKKDGDDDWGNGIPKKWD